MSNTDTMTPSEYCQHRRDLLLTQVQLGVRFSLTARSIGNRESGHVGVPAAEARLLRQWLAEAEAQEASE